MEQHSTLIEHNPQSREVLALFVRHQCNTWSTRAVAVTAECVWIGRIPTPQSDGDVQIRTQVTFCYDNDPAKGSSSIWMPDRGWVETLPRAPYPSAPMFASADVSYEKRVEVANELVLLATVAFLRTTAAFR